MNKIIAVVGTTGVGKTSLVQALAATGKFVPSYEEHINRPYQVQFANNGAFAFHNQIDYLLMRAEQELVLRKEKLPGLIDGGLEMDYYGFSQLFHTRGYLSDDECSIIQRLYKLLRTNHPEPELIIYLTAPAQKAQKRLAKRNRINAAKPEDIQLLDTFIKDWLITLPEKRCITIDVSTDDPNYRSLVPSLKTRILNHLEV